MKQIIFISAMLVTLQINFAQPHFEPSHKMGKKFRQLEKIKLLEILELEEETAIRFFSRKNLNLKNQKELFAEHENLLIKLENEIKKDPIEEDKLQKLITRNENLEMKIHQQKKNFIDSVKDILTTEQIAKLVLFEYKFKKEVRDLLIKGGKKRFLKYKRNKKKTNGK